MKRHFATFSLRHMAISTFLTVFLAGCTATGPGVGTENIPGKTIGNGSVKVALILPLSGSASTAGQSMLKAAELAHKNISKAGITILVKDDASSPSQAKAAASAALAEGAEIILGPLTANQTQSVAEVSRSAGKPVISFSTDTTVASPGVYLMGFLPQAETEQIISYAAAQGKKSIAALIPQSAYGNVVEAALLETASRKGIRIALVERYAEGQAFTAAKKIVPLVTGDNPEADALFLPDSGTGMNTVNTALQSAGFNAAKVKLLGTGVWARSGIFSLSMFQGAWFTAPDTSGYHAFVNQYRSQYGNDPVRVASQTYDAVSLVAALVRTQGAQRFSESVLTNSAGFAGADGVFRFRSNGTNDRALAIFEVQSGSSRIIRAAPKSFSR